MTFKQFNFHTNTHVYVFIQSVFFCSDNTFQHVSQTYESVFPFPLSSTLAFGTRTSPTDTKKKKSRFMMIYRSKARKRYLWCRIAITATTFHPRFHESKRKSRENSRGQPGILSGALFDCDQWIPRKTQSMLFFMKEMYFWMK